LFEYGKKLRGEIGVGGGAEKRRWREGKGNECGKKRRAFSNIKAISYQTASF